MHGNKSGKKNRLPLRQHKTKDQLIILKAIYEKYGGNMNRKARMEAVEQTGLEWIKIYKWFFDK